MNWLSPFFAPASLLELAVVVAVFYALWTRANSQNAKLAALIGALQSERAALQQATSSLESARSAGENAPTRAARFGAIVNANPNSMLAKRAQLAAPNSTPSPETELPQLLREVIPNARNLQNTFVLIGLAGALICLLFAVAHITITVGRNPKDTILLVRAICGGVGAALLSTTIGVGFRLWLAERTNVAQRAWENLRDEIEAWVQLEIEPLSARKTDDGPRLENAVSRMETVASAFSKTLEITLASWRESQAIAAKLQQASDVAAHQLEQSAANLGQSSGEFAGAAGELASNLNSLQKTLNAHGETLGHSTREWNKIGVTSMDLLRASTERASQTFLDLGELRADIAREIGATQTLAREMHDSALTLGNNIERANTSVLARLQEEVGRGLIGVGDAVERGVESQAQLLAQFRAVLETMSEYAMRVEETIAQLPASMGTEPLLLLENSQDAGLNRIGEGVGNLRTEIAELRAAITRDLPAILSHSTNDNLAGVHQNVAALRDEVRAGIAASQSVDGNVAGLSAQINDLNAQITELRATGERLDRGIVIPLPRGK